MSLWAHRYVPVLTSHKRTNISQGNHHCPYHGDDDYDHGDDDHKV